MDDKIRIVPGSVQETLIIPLYGRKLCSERFSSLYTDTTTATVSTRGYMLGYRPMDDPNVTGLHRKLAWLCDRVVKMRIVRMDCA